MIRIIRTAAAAAGLAAAGAALISLGAGQAAAQTPYGCNAYENIVDAVVTADASGTICQAMSDGTLSYVGLNRNDGSTVTIDDVVVQSAAGLSSYTATADDGTTYDVLPHVELIVRSPSGQKIFDEPAVQ